MRVYARAGLAAALLCALLAGVDGQQARQQATPPAADDEPDLDDESDSAAFMMEVVHSGGGSCSAALVSLRTALTSAGCAGGGGELWALPAPATPAARAAARRVLRVVLALDRDTEEGRGAAGVAGDPWGGVAADLALLQLEEAPAHARPILLATEPADCAPPLCHLVRRLHGAPEGGARLRIVDARLDGGETCAALGPRWSSLRAHTLCLAGPLLCQSDRGTGVVCDGKLCGVVSRSAGGGGRAAAGAGCGTAHAAPAVLRWRRFLHCAHTPGACTREGECAAVCRETWLGEPSLAAGNVTRAAWPASPPAAPLRTANTAETFWYGSTPGRTGGPGGPGASSAASVVAGNTSSQRQMLEFEPNRADFTISPARTSRVFLKAGEYGDNAAEYAAPEERALAASVAPTPATHTAPAPVTRTARGMAQSARTAAAAALAARPSDLTPAPRLLRSASTTPSLNISLLDVLFLFYMAHD